MTVRISVLVVVRNAQDHIIPCIQSIESQFESRDSNWELIVVDGKSSDRTKEITKAYLNSQMYPSQILDNDKQILASGWNIGIKAANGDFVLRPDVHARLKPGYISDGLDVLRRRKDVTVVGGRLNTVSTGFWGRIIASALSSRIGVGGSPFRTAVESGPVDSVAYGIYRKRIFEKVGLFDESLVRHQDNELHRRIHLAGGAFYLEMKMSADYYCRSSLRKLWKQMWQNGYYLTDISLRAMRIRHVAPLAFFTGLFGLILFSFFHPVFLVLGLILGVVYGFSILVAGLALVIRSRRLSDCLTTLVFPSMHLAYAVGMGQGFIQKAFFLGRRIFFRFLSHVLSFRQTLNS